MWVLISRNGNSQSFASNTGHPCFRCSTFRDNPKNHAEAVFILYDIKEEVVVVWGRYSICKILGEIGFHYTVAT